MKNTNELTPPDQLDTGKPIDQLAWDLIRNPEIPIEDPRFAIRMLVNIIVRGFNTAPLNVKKALLLVGVNEMDQLEALSVFHLVGEYDGIDNLLDQMGAENEQGNVTYGTN